MKKVFLLFTAFLLLACTDRAGFLGSPSRPYHGVLSKNTQERRFFTLENLPYHIFITYKSEEFRKAYVKEFSDLYRLTPEKTDELLKQEMDEAKEFDTFVISNFSSEKEGSQITMFPKVWKVTLAGEDPYSISTLPSGNDPVFSHFYPHVSPWASNFLVKFKKISQAENLQVRITGVLADLVFTWKT